MEVTHFGSAPRMKQAAPPSQSGLVRFQMKSLGKEAMLCLYNYSDWREIKHCR